MSEEVGSKVTYLLLGLGVGWLVGILLAPKSGEGSRDYLLQKIKEGRKHARKKARELRERAEDLVERGKEMVSQRKEQIAEGLDEARKDYLPEKSKAKGA
jgi:gas vesicle protein